MIELRFIFTEPLQDVSPGLNSMLCGSSIPEEALLKPLFPVEFT